MKCALVIAGDVKQIMLTAESAPEKAALKLLGEAGQSITVELKTGTFFDAIHPSVSIGYEVNECQGGYPRAFESDASVMLVIRPQPSTPNGGTE